MVENMVNKDFPDGFISVEDRLPDTDEVVSILAKPNVDKKGYYCPILIGYYNANEECWYHIDSHPITLVTVIAWKPILSEEEDSSGVN